MQNSKSVFVSQLLQKYQMVQDRPRHGGMLPIGNSKFFGRLLHDSGQGSVVCVAHERAKMVNDVVVEPAGKPTYDWAIGGVIGRGREDVVHPIVKFAAIRGEIRGVDSVRGLEHQRHSQSNDQMDEQKRRCDQQG